MKRENYLENIRNREQEKKITRTHKIKYCSLKIGGEWVDMGAYENGWVSGREGGSQGERRVKGTKDRRMGMGIVDGYGWS